MLCLLLFSLLITAQANEYATQENNVGPVMDQYASLDLPSLDSHTSDLFDAVVSDAMQEFDRLASLSYEEIKQATIEHLQSNDHPGLPERKSSGDETSFESNGDFGKSANGVFDTTSFKVPTQAEFPRVYP